jgi:hypothetical protein
MMMMTAVVAKELISQKAVFLGSGGPLYGLAWNSGNATDKGAIEKRREQRKKKRREAQCKKKLKTSGTSGGGNSSAEEEGSDADEPAAADAARAADLMHGLLENMPDDVDAAAGVLGEDDRDDDDDGGGGEGADIAEGGVFGFWWAALWACVEFRECDRQRCN